MTERRVNVRGIAFHKGQLLAQKFRTYEAEKPTIGGHQAADLTKMKHWKTA